MSLPTLFLNLSLNGSESDSVEWLRACGDGNLRPPDFESWRLLRSTEKAEFYKLVDLSENDRFSKGNYMLPYTRAKDIDALLSDRQWSVEHVLPRSKVNGHSPGSAENDVFGWEPAYRGTNSSRSNLPLVLWPMPDTNVGRVDIDGETHFNPLEAHKARLARRWLYLRATYANVDVIEPPSKAQSTQRDAIIELVKSTRLEYAELRLGGLLSQFVLKKYGRRWRNPLYDKDLADKFLGSEEWIVTVFN